jgi:UDP:flavonoid glycosyltransferase YjiC (YdhE family)
MRFLFITGGSPATVFALTPLATAARNAGHQVFMAANEDLMAVIADNGVPAVSITPHPIQHFMFRDGAGTAAIPQGRRETMIHVGRAFGSMAEAELDTLFALVRDWRPDVVVGGATTYAAGLVATHLDVPYARHTWDFVGTAEMDEGATEVLAPHLRKLGLDQLPPPAPLIDICPPGLRPVDAPAAQPIRFIPGNTQRRLEPWMYARGSSDHRALITTGTREGPFRAQNAALLRSLADALSTLGIEVLVAAPDDIAEDLRGHLGEARVGWIPLDVAAPTCDVILHHGGGLTAMTAMSAGTPQIIVPKDPYQMASSQPIADVGAGIVLAPGQDPAEHTVQACRDVLADPVYRQRSRLIAEEIAALPSPAEVAQLLEQRAAG